MEVLAFISFFLGASWDFFTEVNVPGFEFSFAALFIGLFLASLGLRFLFAMLGIGGGFSSMSEIIEHRPREHKSVRGFRYD